MGLAAILPEADHLQRLQENAGAEPYFPHGEVDVLAIIGALREFREACAQRDVKSATFGYVLEDLGYALRELKRFYRSRGARRAADMNDKDAYVFAYFVKAKVAELREIAEELDKAVSD